MSLFQCGNCGCVENTALSPCYPENTEDPEEIRKYRKGLGLEEGEPFGRYCSACCPVGKRRKRRGKFERVFLPKGEFETSPDGGLKHKETLEDYRSFVGRTNAQFI